MAVELTIEAVSFCRRGIYTGVTKQEEDVVAVNSVPSKRNCSHLA